MQTMHHSLVNLVNRREISLDAAVSRSPDARELQGMLGRTAAVA
jgi:hypothetical protein